MTRLSGWGGVGLVMVLAMACAKSEEPDWTAACFESSRELEAWDERWRQPCQVESDLDLDGEIDGRTVHEHDAEGRTVVTTSDSRPWSEERWEYDDFGRVIVQEQDDQQGELSFREEHDYDVDGLLLQTRTDTDGDGAIDIVATPEYRLCLLSERPSGAPCSIAYDVDSDGEADGVTTNMWLDGRKEAEVQYDPIERVSIAKRYFYEDHNRIRTEVDVGNDGTVDEIEGTDFASGGAQLRNWIDHDADGTRDEWFEFERAADGSRNVTTVYEPQGPVGRSVSEFDERRNLVRYSVRDQRTPDEDYDAVYRYDAAGNTIATARDFYPYGSADECHYVSYACWVE